VLIWDW